MSKDSTQVTLGVGDLYLNNIEVGHLKGTVTLDIVGEYVDFKPANGTAPVRRFVTRERVTLKASLAEIKTDNLRLALGVSTAKSASVSWPSYDPSSFVEPAASSYDILKFGGDTTVSEVSLRFEHTRPGTTKKIVLVLYKAVSNRNLNIPFNEEDINLQEITWEALADSTRTAGDQIGFIADEVKQ